METRTWRIIFTPSNQVIDDPNKISSLLTAEVCTYNIVASPVRGVDLEKGSTNSCNLTMPNSMTNAMMLIITLAVSAKSGVI
jgi:hypothetical protein